MSKNKMWHPIEELCGFILNDGSVIEVANIASNTKQHFKISVAILEHYLNDIAIFWHSHPSNNTNLSLEDYKAFLAFPDHEHRIYSETQYTSYYVRRGLVIIGGTYDVT